MKIAAYSGLFIEHSIQEALRMIKHLGFDGVEIECLEPHLSESTSLIRIKEIRNLAVHELGLEIPVLAGPMGAFSTASDAECMKSFSSFQKILEWAAILGADAVSIRPGGPSTELAEDYHFHKEAAWICRCAEEAAKYSKKLLLGMVNGSLTETVESSLRLLQMIPHPHAGMIHDAGNLYMSGAERLPLSVAYLDQRLLHVHLKDMRKHSRGTFSHCRFGEGEIDYRLLIKALHKLGYNRWLTLNSTAHLPECGSNFADLCDCSHCAYEKLDYEIKQVKQRVEGG